MADPTAARPTFSVVHNRNDWTCLHVVTPFHSVFVIDVFDVDGWGLLKQVEMRVWKMHFSKSLAASLGDSVFEQKGADAAQVDNWQFGHEQACYSALLRRLSPISETSARNTEPNATHQTAAPSGLWLSFGQSSVVALHLRRCSHDFGKSERNHFWFRGLPA